MDITAIAGVASQASLPGHNGGAREALGQEFGKLFFHALLQAATPSKSGGKGRKAMQSLPLDLLTDSFSRQLAVQHEQMFSQLLWHGAMKETKR